MSSDTIYSTIENLLQKADSALGKKIKDLNTSEKYINKNSKGRIGNIIEEGFFQIKANNRQEVDFPNLGIELKVTGYKWIKNSTLVSTKERLVITMIDYEKDWNLPFYKSHCYKKINKILMMLYEYQQNIPEKEFVISKNYLYEFNKIPKKDKLIILNDYKQIMAKIRKGKAHEISEADTMYLGMCPKGVNKNSIRNQPFSDFPAMQRAFSFKSTYMTFVLRNYIFDEIENKEHLINNLDLLKSKSFEDILTNLLKKYQGKSLSEIDKITNKTVNRKNNKQYLRNYTTNMLDTHSIDNIDEFHKANIQIKTIRINRKGNIKESMSFKSFDFNNLEKETWETSEVNEFFSTTKFLFVIFHEIDDTKNEYYFHKAVLWNMPFRDIDIHIHNIWLKAHNILKNDIEVSIINKRWKNNFPKSTESSVGHIRPHGSDSYDTVPLPKSCVIKIISDDGSKDISPLIKNHHFTKQSFWLNKSYVKKILLEK